MTSKIPLKTRVADFFAQLWSALKSHPVELVILLHATVSALFPKGHWWDEPAAYASFAAVAAFSLTFYRRRSLVAKIAYYAVPILYALCAFLPDSWVGSAEYISLTVLLPIIYMAAQWLLDNKRFHVRFYSVVRSFVVSVGIAVLLYLLLSLVVMSVDFLFKGSYEWYSFIWPVCFILVAPIVFISLESREEPPAVTRLVEVVVNFVITPILMLYNLILYVYAVSILLKWNLPQNSVATMVTVFALIAIGVKWVRPVLQRQPMEFYFRWLGLFTLPLLVLFWVAVVYRVEQYGFTMDRCFLMAGGAVLSIYLVLSVFPLRRLNFCAILVTLLCGLVLSVGGPLSARQLALHSQLHIILEKAKKLEILTPQGTISDFGRNDADTLNCADHRTIYQAMKYIENDLQDSTVTHDMLGMAAADYIDHLSKKTADYATAYRVEFSDIEMSLSEFEKNSYYVNYSGKDATVDVSKYNSMLTCRYIEKGAVPYPGGSIPADTLLATQLAKIGYTLNSTLERDKLDDNAETLCTYLSPDGKVLIVFGYLNIEWRDGVNHLDGAKIMFALSTKE